jgi:hypothetical protein
MTPRLRLIALVAALAPLPGCGGGGGEGGPSQPSGPVSLQVVTGLDFTIVPMVSSGTVVELTWSSSGAPGYRVEVGSFSGGSAVATFEPAGSATSFTWTGVHTGNFYARVRGRDGTTLGPPSADVLIGSIDARQMIDALVFGYGPLAVAGNAAGPIVPDRMEGWQPGTGFEVILGESLTASFTASAEKTVQQIGPATRGAVQAAIVGRRAEPLPPPGPGQVTIEMTGAQQVFDRCECTSCVGCAWTWFSGSFAQRGMILVSSASSPSTVAHELGHEIGLGHIISAAGVRPPFTMGVTTDGQYSPRGQLDVLDPATIRMLDTLYGAGLTAGSTRAQFEAAGLVPPLGEGASFRAPASARKPSGYVVRPDGDETLVIKPACRTW